MKRKLKAMAQLLAEFPSYKFVEGGGLLLIEPQIAIPPKSFDLLGKEIPQDAEKYWDERLLEPLPEPVRRGKLFAYQEEGETFVTWVDWDIPEDAFRTSGKKTPQYNLDLGEIDELNARVEKLEALMSLSDEIKKNMIN